MSTPAFESDARLAQSDVDALCAALAARCGTGATRAELPAGLGVLAAVAEAAARRAHAPYSGLTVGAALVDRTGRVVAGCNVENASFGLTQCAERSAVCRARLLGAEDIAVLVLSSSAGAIPPCGACRQVIAEFAPRGLVVALDTHRALVWRVSDLLPDAFDRHGLPPKTSGANRTSS